MDIYLVRHGEAAASWGQDADPGLSELGLAQAATAAQQLLPCLAGDTVLLSSPLLRARQTAAPFGEALGVPVVIRDAFREIPAPVPLADRRNWLRSFMQQAWAEQPAELLEWRGRALDEVCSLSSPTVIFSHFLVLNAIVGAIRNHPDTLYFWPDNASVTHLVLAPGGDLSLVSLGEQMDTVVN